MNVFILTRFNLKLWWNKDKVGMKVQTEEWLEERFRLFEKYTFPSVRALTYPHFHWICLFDTETPSHYRSRIDNYVSEEPRLDACYVTWQEARKFQDVFRKRVKQLADNKDEGLLTVYLDSDDCLRNDFLDRLMGLATHAKFGTIFSFEYGIQYYEQLNIAIRIPYPNNHFLAYYEKTGERVRTIWGFWHFCIYKYKGLSIQTEDNKDNPMWVEVIHDSNVDNDVKMTLHHRLLTQETLLYSFGLPILIKSGSRAILIFLTCFQWRFLKQIVRRTKNKLRL